MPDIEEANQAIEEKKQQIWDKGQAELAQLIVAHGRVERSLAEKIEFYKPTMEGLEKWLLASLVVINGGAAIALLGHGEGHLILARIPLAIFSVGVVCALLSGLMTREAWGVAISAHDRSVATHESLGEIAQIKDYRDFLQKSGEIQTKFKAIKAEGSKAVRAMTILGVCSTGSFYGSLICFVVGCVTAGSLIR